MILRSICLASLLLFTACSGGHSPAPRTAAAPRRATDPEMITLPDARRMAVYHFGDPQGAPLLFFHGWPHDASTALLLDSAARKQHLRVIAPDRPGIGRSEPQPHRKITDWPADVRAIATHYGLGSFAVLGVSGGAPYALATARAMPGKVTSATVISGAPPLDGPRDAATLPSIYRRLIRGQSSHPETMRMEFRALRPLMSHVFPDALIHLAMLKLPAPDRATLANSHDFKIMFGGMRRSWAASSDGVYEDAVLYTRPWGFSPSQIRTRVEIWHGAMDSNFPPELARKLAASIPGAHLHIVPGEGHYSLPVKQTETILAAIARPSR
jgi:pimeloyl-ACP methyl ester carboxylesterase